VPKNEYYFGKKKQSLKYFFQSIFEKSILTAFFPKFNLPRTPVGLRRLEGGSGRRPPRSYSRQLLQHFVECVSSATALCRVRF